MTTAPASSSLRYRLRSVVSPRRRVAGGILVGLTLFLLLFSFGYVALSYDERPGSEVIFGGDPAGYTLHAVWRDGELLDCSDQGAMMDYLSTLSLARLTGDYDYSLQGQTTYTLYFDPSGPDTKSLCIVLSGNQCKIRRSYSARYWPYYLPDGVDTDRLNTLLAS